MNTLEDLRFIPDEDVEVIDDNIDDLRFIPDEPSETLLSTAGKSFLKGITSIGDLPKLGAQGLEAIAVSKANRNPGGLYAPDFTNDNVEIPDLDVISSNIPDSSDLRDYIRENTGVDLEPRPANNMQKYISKPLEFAGGFGLLGALSKAGNAARTVKTAKPLISGFKEGAKQGAASGIVSNEISKKLTNIGLPEEYSEPLGDVASISVNTPLAVKKLKEVPIFSRFGDKQTKKEFKVNKLVKDLTKGKDLSNLHNFRPKAFEELGTFPVTAEVALNQDISNLHNVYAPNFTDIQRKQQLNDAILRNKLNEIGNKLNPSNVELGEAGREVVVNNLNKLKKVRKEQTTPLYAQLEKSNELYPVENLNKYTDSAILKEVDDLEEKLRKNKNILPVKYKKLIEKPKKELAELEKEIDPIVKQIDEKYPGLSFQAKEQILSELVPGLREKTLKIVDLKTQISNLETGKYKPVHIDNTIKRIGKKIKQVKRSDEGGDKALIRHFNNQKKALEADLQATPEGLAHRTAYKEYSPGINEINRDKLLKKYVSKDEWGKYKTAVDDLPRQILDVPQESVVNYSKQIKDTDAEKLTKAYIRNMYLNKAVDIEGGLPSYDKSSNFLRQKGKKLEGIYSPEELEEFKRVNKYLKNKAIVSSGNSKFGSATAPKGQLKDIVSKYLGPEIEQPLISKLYKYIPKAPFKSVVSNLNRLNPNYNVLQEFLTDPVYAQKVLSLEPKTYGNWFNELRKTNYGTPGKDFYTRVPSVLSRNFNDN